jgi:hypothetical protein
MESRAIDPDDVRHSQHKHRDFAAVEWTSGASSVTAPKVER